MKKTTHPALRHRSSRPGRVRPRPGPEAGRPEVSRPSTTIRPIPAVPTAFANGLRGYVQEDHTLPLVSVSALVNFGGLYLPKDKQGLESLMSGTMIRGGTKTKEGTAIEERLDFLGGSLGFNVGRADLDPDPVRPEQGPRRGPGPVLRRPDEPGVPGSAPRTWPRPARSSSSGRPTTSRRRPEPRIREGPLRRPPPDLAADEEDLRRRSPPPT